MARGGINKALVKMAIDRLKARGEHPSIDAIRVELGNTGSKTTISRYVAELNDAAEERLSNVDTLSSALTEIIADLASQLQLEAQTTAVQAADAYETEIKRLKGSLDERQQQLALSQQQCTALELTVAQSHAESAKLKTSESELLLKIERQTQQLASQDILNQQKDAHIQSLEEKHQHARESLEHYRESVKEQREQEQRRHEHQVQQLQSEIRQLGQTISVKQTEITQLTKDSARLASELNESRKQLRTSEQKLDAVSQSAKTLEDSLTSANDKLVHATRNQQEDAGEINALKEKLIQVQHESDTIKSEFVFLKTELTIKNQLIETFRPQLRSTENVVQT